MKRRLLAICGTLALIAGLGFTADNMAAHAGTAHHTPIHQNQALKYKIGYFYVIHDAPPIGTESGFALNDPGGSTLNGVQLQLWSEPQSNEGFAAVFQGTTNGVNFYHLQMANGMCAGVPAGQHQNGGKVILWLCQNGVASQNWADSSYYRNGQFPVQWLSQVGFSFSDGTGYGIDDTNDVNHDGNPIQEWYIPGGNESQVWVGP